MRPSSDLSSNEPLPRRFVVALALALPALLAACGGSQAKPAEPMTPEADAPASTTPAKGAADASAEPSTTAAADAASATPPASTSAASTAPPPPAEPADECAPVGVDFEKRARAKLKDCYREGKKKDPNLQGTVRIAVEINTLGKIKGTKITEKTLPDPVAQCMLKVVKATPMPEAAKCPGKIITIPVTFPTPH